MSIHPVGVQRDVRLNAAVQMFIDWLLENREELEKHITEKHRRETRETLARIEAEKAQNAKEDSVTD